MLKKLDVGGLGKDRSYSSVLVMELLQSCTKPPMSSHENAIHITGPVWWKSISHWWISFCKSPAMEVWMIVGILNEQFRYH